MTDLALEIEGRAQRLGERERDAVGLPRLVHLVALHRQVAEHLARDDLFPGLVIGQRLREPLPEQRVRLVAAPRGQRQLSAGERERRAKATRRLVAEEPLRLVEQLGARSQRPLFASRQPRFLSR